MMTSILQSVSKNYKDYFYEKTDHRVREWMLMSTPLTVVVIVIAYVYFVKVLGPKLMANKKPLEIKKVMIFYNAFQIIFNSYLLGIAIVIIRRNTGNIFCSLPDLSNTPKGLLEASGTHLYFMSKVSDLLDTVFMVLRKKYNQITFLHVYHHSAMVVLGWLFTAYLPGGHVAYFGAVNTLIHVIMYSYYLVAAIYPEYGRSAWWKKYLTQMQLGQFVVVTIHSTIASVNPYCAIPKSFISIFLPQGIIMYILFWDFYKKAYLKKKLKESINEKSD